jgi:hypothetical protein
MNEVRDLSLGPTAVDPVSYFPRSLPTISIGIETIVGLLVLLCTGITILILWINPDRAWLHPELAMIGSSVSSAPDDLATLLGLIVDWHQFAGETLRARPVTGFFEVIDAWVRPSIASVFAHPALGVTTVLYVTLVPTLLYRTLLLFSFSVGQALLFCALLIATPGFLSNLFAYIHMGKPLSFILLAATVYCLARYSLERRGRQLAAISAIMFVGLVTDELMLWSIFFVPGSLVLLGTFKPARRVFYALSTAIGLYVVTLLLILPWIYATYGSYEEKLPALSPATGEHPALQMLSYLFRPDFYLSAARVTVRSVLASFGSASTSALAIGLAATAVVAGICVVAACIKHRDHSAWKLGAVGLWGLCSFAPFGTWLLWFNGPPALEGYASLTYYYNSPISLLVVLCVAAAFKGLESLIASGSSRRAAAVALALTAVLGVAIVRDIVMFCKLNDVVRFVHLGPTDTATFFNVASEGYEHPAPALIVVTGDKNRFERLIERTKRQGEDLFGRYLRSSLNAAYYDPSYFDNMAWFGPSYALFGQRYGNELCVVYFGAKPCPVTFRETALPSNPP